MEYFGRAWYKRHNSSRAIVLFRRTGIRKMFFFTDCFVRSMWVMWTLAGSRRSRNGAKEEGALRNGVGIWSFMGSIDLGLNDREDMMSDAVRAVIVNVSRERNRKKLQLDLNLLTNTGSVCQAGANGTVGSLLARPRSHTDTTTAPCAAGKTKKRGRSLGKLVS